MVAGELLMQPEEGLRFGGVTVMVTANGTLAKCPPDLLNSPTGGMGPPRHGPLSVPRPPRNLYTSSGLSLALVGSRIVHWNVRVFRPFQVT